MAVSRPSVQRRSGIRGFEDIGSQIRLIVGRGTTGETMARQRVPDAQFIFVESPGDAMLLMTLAPGSYTVQVSGVGGAAGETLVEIYEVP